MPAAPVHFSENERLASLNALDLLDSAAEVEFDELVKAAALVCETPISLISLIDSNRQWFKANVGLEGTTETHRDSAFCAHAINDIVALQVPDATRDARFADNPLVLGAPGIRFYAGIPLQLSNGSVIGTLCVIDRRPRQLSATQLRILGHLARSAVSAMESRRERRLADMAEGSIRAFESRWRHVFENLQDGFLLGEVVRDGAGNVADWRYVDVNASWSRMVGVP
jgi:GAF domain-containing protein